MAAVYKQQEGRASEHVMHLQDKFLNWNTIPKSQLWKNGSIRKFTKIIWINTSMQNWASVAEIWLLINNHLSQYQVVFLLRQQHLDIFSSAVKWIAYSSFSSFRKTNGTGSIACCNQSSCCWDEYFYKRTY